MYVYIYICIRIRIFYFFIFSFTYIHTYIHTGLAILTNTTNPLREVPWGVQKFRVPSPKPEATSIVYCQVPSAGRLGGCVRRGFLDEAALLEGNIIYIYTYAHVDICGHPLPPYDTHTP